MSEEDKELIAIYGPKIHQVRWLFENDSEVQSRVANKVFSKKEKKMMRNGNNLFLNRVPSDNLEEEEINLDYDFINNIGY